MRRTLAVLTAVAAGLVLAGCAEEADPIAGEWVAQGAQPPGYADFADGSSISVDKDGRAVLGTSPTRLCGDAEVTAQGEEEEEGGGGGLEYRIAFESACVSVNVPMSLDVVVDGDSLVATPSGQEGGEPFRFRRAE
ncbi:hypothetical protein ABZX40_07680 [Streptomyces sp. NPDC004610]|uniref:hypothetical protein n=1 Tax=unclassified Streptomyces TaxID=2593676 RepID=UPI0033BE9553